jgi:Ras GTPase-activating-like protein IQGAP2/3
MSDRSPGADGPDAQLAFFVQAQRLYEKGILLAAKEFSPKQFDKLFIIISCDEVGIFKVEVRFMDKLVKGNSSSSTSSHQNNQQQQLGGSSSHAGVHKDGIDELRMEDLLEDQFSGKQSLNLEIVKLNLNLLLHLIKFSLSFPFSFSFFF